MTISCFCLCFASVCSVCAMFCQESHAFLHCCQVQGLQGKTHLASLSTRLMSCQCLYLLPHCLPSQPLPCSAQKEVRQRARGFLCAFRHFLSRFSKYFLPHVSTLFNVVHGRVFAWRVGGVGWHAATVYCTSSKQKPTPQNCLQMNELSQSGLEKYLTTK